MKAMLPTVNQTRPRYLMNFFSLIVLSLLMSFSCSSLAAESEELFQQRTLRTGFYLKSFPDLTRVDLEVALRFWSDEVGQEVGISSEVYIYDDLQQMRNDFDQGKINFIVASTLLVVNEFDQKQLVDGYKIILNDSGAEDKLLVVRHKGSGLKGFEGMQGKDLSLLNYDSISAMYANLLSLKSFGKKAAKLFKKINYEVKSDQLIYQLFFNKTDVILVYQASYELACELNPQIRQQTYVASVLPQIPRGVGFFHRSVPAEFRDFVLTEIGKLDTYPRGRQLLALFKAEKTVRSNLSDLDTTKQLKQGYQLLLKQHGIK